MYKNADLDRLGSTRYHPYVGKHFSYVTMTQMHDTMQVPQMQV